MQHYLWDIAQQPSINAGVYDAWENGYVPVNRAFAEAVVGVAAQGSSRPVVMFQDYQLYMAPGFTRELVPDALLTHFIHIPWPAPRYWSLLPATFRTPILASLCQNDIVGFQTHRDVHNFLYTCEYLLPDARVNYQRGTIRYGRRLMYARSYPISIDVEAVRATAASPEAATYLDRLTPLAGQQTVMRVDRMEPTKNLVRGFQAFDTLLTRYPQLAGKVKFLAFLVPSRTELAFYQRHCDEVMALVEQINTRHGHDAWKPVEVFYENNYMQAIAGMTLYDALLVNSVMDGMNLVAKEGVTVNQRDGVLILSETAGAFEQMGRHAIAVSAADIEGQVRALYQALTMSKRERRSRARRLRATVATSTIADWAEAQRADITTLLQGGRLQAQRRVRPVSTGQPGR